MPKIKPTLPNESGQARPPLDPKKAARRERKADKRAARGQATAPAPGGSTSHGESGSQPVAADASRRWATEVLQGDFSSNPIFERLTSDEELDVRNNPNLQPVIESIQREGGEDLLRNLWDADAQSQSMGRAGSGYSAALQMRNREETAEAVNDAISKTYLGAHEAARQRAAGLAGQSLSTQAQAAGIPVAWANDETARRGIAAQRAVGMGNVNVARGHLDLARGQAEQDALMDYANILFGLGGMGGTQQGSGNYMPSGGNPYAAALMGGVGGYLQGS